MAACGRSCAAPPGRRGRGAPCGARPCRCRPRPRRSPRPAALSTQSAAPAARRRSAGSWPPGLSEACSLPVADASLLCPPAESRPLRLARLVTTLLGVEGPALRLSRVVADRAEADRAWAWARLDLPHRGEVVARLAAQHRVHLGFAAGVDGAKRRAAGVGEV